MKRLIENSNIPERLVRGVIRQMGGWESFKESAPDICNGGIDGGFHGFIYNRETEAFARRFRAEIAQMAGEQAKDFGCGVIAMIQGFGCFRHNQEKPTEAEIGSALYAGKDLNDSGVLNALAWYAGEEVSRAYENMTEAAR